MKEMNNIDDKIVTGVDKINSLIEENEKNKPAPYKFLTNLKYNDKNLRTLDMNGLTEMLSVVVSNINNLKYCIENELEGLPKPDIDTWEVYGFKLVDWKSDILYLMKNKHYINTKTMLETKLARINELHTQEFKDNAEVEDILNSL